MAAISDVFDRARVVLNDTIVLGGTIYNNDALLPLVKIANDELSDYLIVNGVTVQKQIQAVIPVPAGDKTLNLPDDIIVPITLYEKVSGAPEADYARMKEMAWESNTPQATALIYWTWRNQDVNFNGATTIRDVRLDYIRLLAEIQDENTLVEVLGSVNFLSFRTAALGARHIGENSVKANELDIEAIRYRDKLLQIGVRKNQSIRGRRRPFRLPFMSRYY